ncbi:MAG: molybdate ABC transporter substrate-binding protein [Gammaproteobacteria bacterium]|nr:molybdate ABC transporter substrate-binding protein [Gammaproteobacteria bacterium]
MTRRCLMIRMTIAALAAALAPAGPGAAVAQPAPLVAAASDLQFALEEIAAAFTRDTNTEVRLVFGSSGNFARQIGRGAPFEIFLSADESFVHGLAERGLTRDDGVLYAVGRIVLFAPTGGPLAGDLSAQGLRDALASGRLARFAIANPEHAPYGRAAEQWLRRNDLWDAVQPALILGENASQAAQFASSGAADGGIIPYSLALAPRVGERGSSVLLAAEQHEPLRQRMVLLENAGAVAERFYDYMQQPAARQIMRRYGFTLPEE